MELPLIVLIDTEARKIFTYGQYNREFLLEELHVLKALIKDKNVIYIKQAYEYSADETISAIRDVLEALGHSPESKRYYRVKKDGYTLIPEVKIRFAGPKDCRPTSEFGDDIFEKSTTMTNLLLNGTLEVLSQEEVDELKTKKKMTARQDNDILLKVKAMDFEPTSLFDGKEDVDDEVEVETDEQYAIRNNFGKKESSG